MAPWVLLDDTFLTTGFNLWGNSWTRQTNQPSTYNSTLTTWSTGAESSIPPELSLFYYGADISFYGTMTADLAANYTIDGTTRRPVPFAAGIANGKTGINLFNITGLTGSTSHSLSFFPSSGKFTLDYVTYLPNSHTPLSGLDLILDDTDTSLRYSQGHWNNEAGDFNGLEGRPYNGTITGTYIIGATMQMNFVGSDISVYGLLNQGSGRLSASFVVDGNPASSGNYTPFGDGGNTNGDSSNWKFSQQFFHKDLAPGSHSLLITLTDVSESQILWIDSIVYEASSATTLSGVSPPTPSSVFPNIRGRSALHLSKGVIIGVVAGVFLICVGAVRYVIYLKNRSRRSPPDPVTEISINPSTHNTTYQPPYLSEPRPTPPTWDPYSNGRYTSPARDVAYHPASGPTQYPIYASPIPTLNHDIILQPAMPQVAYSPPQLLYTDSTYSANTTTPKLTDMYTYSAKADSIGLQWGSGGVLPSDDIVPTRSHGSEIPSSPLMHEIPRDGTVALNGGRGDMGIASTGHATTNISSNGEMARTMHVDGGDGRDLNSIMQERRYSHAEEDGRDEGPSEHVESDNMEDEMHHRENAVHVIPAHPPPAYDDH